MLKPLARSNCLSTGQFSFGPYLRFHCRELRCRGYQGRSRFSTAERRQDIEVGGRRYSPDEWTNVPETILSSTSRRLHLQKDHPLSITRQLFESQFPRFKTYNSFSPVVTTTQNFDSLSFPLDHPGRSRTDTYYLNQKTVLRTHTSAHQADIFRANESDGYLIGADVYRRDAIDRSHYPIFHQMEGALTWDGYVPGDKRFCDAIKSDIMPLASHDAEVLDPNPVTHPERNPLQAQHHTVEVVDAIAAHLKRSIENAVLHIFSRAREVAASADVSNPELHEPLKMRWVEAYFPFTSPSWELEVYWQGDWLEVLGCGVVKQELLINAGVPNRVGWAFGLGLERIAMLLFNIPDIRLFWSQDRRFLDQFGESRSPLITRFAPFSKHPPCYKDVSFWLASSSGAGGLSKRAAQDFHENDFMELVRETCGDLVEDVRLTDEFTHPKTSRRSRCFRINYRSLDRTLTNDETNALHERVRTAVVEQLGVELR